MRTSRRSWNGRRTGRRARGGLAAAAAFLERAALLTPDPVGRAERLLAAARANREAGELDAALGLLVVVEAGRLDALQGAKVERLRGQIAADQRRGGRTGSFIAMELWDFESGYALASRQVVVPRDAGALVQLQLALNFLGLLHLVAGELSAAERGGATKIA